MKMNEMIISKKEQQSDWGDPNLSEKQIKYAASDTEYLFDIRKKLIQMLEREKRIDLYKDCLKFLKTRVELDLRLFEDDIWAH